MWRPPLGDPPGGQGAGLTASNEPNPSYWWSEKTTSQTNETEEEIKPDCQTREARVPKDAEHPPMECRGSAKEETRPGGKVAKREDRHCMCPGDTSQRKPSLSSEGLRDL